jgi:hypothetical protein
MLRMGLVLALAGCIDPVDARWQLDHDHVIAVRATPPRIMPGEQATLEALVAHAGAGVSLDNPNQVTTPTAPAGLEGRVSFDGDRWIVTAPDASSLASTRPAMGLTPDDPVPLDLLLVFGRRAGDPLYVTKTVYLGDHADNPVVPPITVDAAPATAELAIPLGRDVYIEAATTDRVNWLTSCGDLFQDDVARAFIRADEACTGELVVVVRDGGGGVAWHIWPLAAH